MNGWYVVSINKNWRGSPLNAIRSREVRIVCISVRPATMSRYQSPEKVIYKSERTVANASDFFVGKDAVFMEVSKVTRLFNECGRKTVSISLVVDEFSVDVVIDLECGDLSIKMSLEEKVNHNSRSTGGSWLLISKTVSNTLN